MRTTYRESICHHEYRELIVEDRPHGELIDAPAQSPRPSRTERFVRGAWAAMCWLCPAILAATCWLCPVVLAVVAAPVVLLVVALVVLGFVVLELLLLVAACGGLLGRGLDHAGRAAARNSRVITASAELLAQLPRPRGASEPAKLPALATVRAP